MKIQFSISLLVTFISATGAFTNIGRGCRSLSSNSELTLLANADNYIDGAKIPVDISGIVSQRKLTEAANDMTSQLDNRILLPNSDIVSLDGGENLGVLLWTYVIFNGIFTTNQQPNEWILPVLARIIPGDQMKEQWYLDFEAGFDYTTPPIIDFVRLAVFTAGGYVFNSLVIDSFGGDNFWGWSIGACLCFPAALIRISRPAKPDRGLIELENSLRLDFEEFAAKYLTRVPGKRTRVERILVGFRRSSMAYRLKMETISDKMLMRIVRQWVGYKPVDSPLGAVYEGLELSSPRKNAQKALSAAMEKVDRAQGEEQLPPLEEKISSNHT